MSKKCPVGEVLVLAGVYFFSRWALLLRPFNIWWQKCLFRGFASMEVRWPQLLWDLILIHWQKSDHLAKFDHHSRSSGSWVMSSFVQKTSKARLTFTKCYFEFMFITPIVFSNLYFIKSLTLLNEWFKKFESLLNCFQLKILLVKL